MVCFFLWLSSNHHRHHYHVTNNLGHHLLDFAFILCTHQIPLLLEGMHSNHTNHRYKYTYELLSLLINIGSVRNEHDMNILFISDDIKGLFDEVNDVNSMFSTLYLS